MRILEQWPKQLYKTINPKSFVDVFDSSYPSLAVVKKVEGKVFTRAIMVLIISDVCLFYNTGQNMSQSQIAELSDFIIEDYYYLKIDDFKLCFNNGKKGVYGDVYRVDGGVLLSWIERYRKERNRAAEEDNFNKHQSTKSESRSVNEFTDVYNRMKNK